MVRLNWSYVAGFFDGEGNISICGNAARRAGQYAASFSQSGKNGVLLLSQIKEFLAVEGHPSNLVPETEEQQKKRGHQKKYQLKVSGRKNLLPFLVAIFPHLRIKRVAAQDAIRFLKFYPSAQHCFARFENPRNQIRVHLDLATIIADRELGMTFHAIAAKHGTSTMTVYRRFYGQSRKKEHGFL